MAGPSTGSKRVQLLEHIIVALQKLAATQNIAAVLLTQCATRMQNEQGPVLIPAINAPPWEQGISTRLVLFRDWLLESGQSRSVHVAGIQKVNGKDSVVSIDHMAAFTLDVVRSSAETLAKTSIYVRSWPTAHVTNQLCSKDGIVHVSIDHDQPPSALSSTPVQNRKSVDAGIEVADSEDDDYGWQVEDESELPQMPSQWQGSEDLLLNRCDDSDNGDEDGKELVEPGDGDDKNSPPRYAGASAADDEAES